MTSILTNVAALGALQTLRTIDQNMEATQDQISSGYRVKDASENAAYWSISSSMKSDQSSMGTIVDALGLAAAKTDTTYAGLNQTIDLLKKIKDKMVTASEPGVDRDKVGNEIDQLKKQLVSVGMSASFSGENWLYNSTTGTFPTKKMVGALTRNASGQIGIETIDFNAANSILLDKGDARRGLLTNRNTIDDTGDIFNYFLVNITSQTTANQGVTAGTTNNTTTYSAAEIVVSSAVTDKQLSAMLKSVDNILKTVTNVTAELGAIKARVDSQTNFVKDLVSVIEKGVGQLVDADMNEASTRLKALQTQQQLGIQSLSIANTNASNIMQLFRNG